MSTEQSFESALNLRYIIEDHFEAEQLLPAFLLLYAEIDILASLARPEHMQTTKGQSGRLFKEWVDKYMLPGSKLNCNSNDLWAARCGLLHTMTAESDDSYHQRARHIDYLGEGVSVPQRPANDPEMANETFISIPLFRRAFLAGCNRFQKEVHADPNLKHRVMFHAEKLIKQSRNVA